MALENFQNFHEFPASIVSKCFSHALFLSVNIVLFLIATILFRFDLSSCSRVEHQVLNAFFAFFAAALHSDVHLRLTGGITIFWGEVFVTRDHEG